MLSRVVKVIESEAWDRENAKECRIDDSHSFVNIDQGEWSNIDSEADETEMVEPVNNEEIIATQRP
jgi:hypothetical protein